jgi:hypothetical protein
MAQLSEQVLLEKSEKTNCMERRASVRFGCELPGSCEPHALPTACQPEVRWHGVVRDISKGGVKLSMWRRFEPGTVLHLDIPMKQGDHAFTRSVVVVHVQQKSGSNWEFGCKFQRPLSDEEINRLI